MKKPKTLRARMTGTIFLSMLLLWGVLMSVVYGSTKSRIEMQTNNRLTENTRYLRQNIEVVAEGTVPPEDKRAIHEYRLSNNASALNGRGGGLTYRMYDVDGTELARTQLAYGAADTSEDVRTVSGGNLYHLSMDEALDDEGLLAYLNWIVAYRYRDRAYVLRAPEAEYDSGDGTVALVTGVVEYNHIRVQRIVLRHPDGGETLVLEGEEETFAGEALTTLEFPSITLDSPLLPGLSWSDGEQRNELVDLQARLKQYRATEARLDAGFTGRGPHFGSGLRREDWEDGTSLAYAWSYSPGLCVHDELLTTYLFTLLVALALGLFLSKHLSGKLSRPLEQLTCDTQAGRLCAAAGPIREVNTLAASFNTAQKKMADDLKREQDLTRAVAHELKTPLAILRAHAEALQEDIDPAKREQYLSIIMDESDRMAALVGELLDLSRMEAGAEVLHRETVDLKALTERVFAPLQNLARVSLDLEPVALSGDPKLLERAISNYASNALRHCAEGGEIRVSLRREGEKALLTVENDGDPIPPTPCPTSGTPSTRRTAPAHGAPAPAWASPLSVRWPASTAPPAEPGTGRAAPFFGWPFLAILRPLWYHKLQVIGGFDMNIDRKELKRQARATLAQTHPNPILVTLVYLLITSAVSGGVNLTLTLSAGLGTNQAMLLQVNQTYGMLYFFLNILVALFGVVMSFGYTVYVLRAADGAPSGFGDLFSGFPETGRILLMNLALMGFYLVWSLAVVFPGVMLLMVVGMVLVNISEGLAVATMVVVYIAMVVFLLFLVVRYALSTLVLADDPTCGPLNAVRRSRSLMRGRSGEYFLLQLSFLGWMLLGVLIITVVVSVVVGVTAFVSVGNPQAIAVAGLVAGLLGFLASLPLMAWLNPYISVTNALYYRALAPGAVRPDQPLPDPETPWRP